VLLDIVGSKVRFTVLASLAKGSKLSIPVTPRSVARVYGVNLTETYRFFRRLESSGLAVRVRGGYVLSERGLALVDFVVSTLPNPTQWSSPFMEWVRRSVPDTMYYIAYPRLQSWFGLTPYLIVFDRRLAGALELPKGIKVVDESSGLGEGLVLAVFTSLRGRSFKYSWDYHLPIASLEQGYADLISYTPFWANIIPDVLLNMDVLDIDEIFDRATGAGRRRLATALAYYMALTGRVVTLKTPLYSLVDEGLLSYVIKMTPYLLDSRILEARNI
jgi:hypothetical protein